jgi:hypothetical protein
MEKRRFSSHLISDEISTRGYKVPTSTECKIVIIVMLSVMSSLRSS